MSTAPARQSVQDRTYILANLPEGTRRVQVVSSAGKQQYKRPEDVDVSQDEIVISSDGTPVIMRGKPGRPRNTALQPVTPQIAEVSQARDAHWEHSEVLKGAKKDPEHDDVFNTLLQEMAKEAESIEFDRMEAQRHGQETANLASKRARVLKGMADLWLARKKISETKMIDMESPAFKNFFSFTLETFKGAMNSAGCRGELVETVFTHLSKEINDAWKEEARIRMKGGK